MQRVFVIDKNKQALMPCHLARARELLRKGKAAVYRTFPFTIILKEHEGGGWLKQRVTVHARCVVPTSMVSHRVTVCVRSAISVFKRATWLKLSSLLVSMPGNIPDVSRVAHREVSTSAPLWEKQLAFHTVTAACYTIQTVTPIRRDTALSLPPPKGGGISRQF